MSSMQVAHGRRILVGVSVDLKASSELLSRGIELLARSNDTVIALHVLFAKEEQKIGSDIKRFRQAKASVISMLGELAEISKIKQVRLEAKVRSSSSSIGEGLAEEAALLGANFLILGSGSSRISQGKSYLITKYCFKHIPENCSLIVMDKQTQSLPPHNAPSDSAASENDHSLSFKWANKETPASKSPFTITNLFGSKIQRGRRHSAGESFGDLSSPVTVLDGLEEIHSASSNYNGGMNKRKIWRGLSMVKLLLPLFRTAADLTVKEIGDDYLSRNCKEQKPSWRCFSYDEISHATRNFHTDNLVGRGGYSEVFKGTLHGVDIAVKRLSKNNKEEKEREFLAELGILGHVCHPNTTSLKGCCFENGFHLIFDFCPNGSLASSLHGKSNKLLEWSTRYKIAVGIARGTHYLHKGCPHRIIHRDIKASNVLLGSNYEPQISDFGLAKWLPKQLSHHSISPIEGTFGYLAPEYFMYGMVDEKTDVFAFGVLLLEIVTGKKPIDSSKQSLLVWAKPFMESGKFTELVDPRLGDNYDEEQAKRLVQIASYCVRPSPIWRPSMTEVQQLLSDGNSWLEAWKEVESWKITECHNDDFDDFSIESDIYFAR